MQDDYHVKVVCRNTDRGNIKPYDGIQPNVWTTLPSTSIDVLYVDKTKVNAVFFEKVIVEAKPDYIYLNSLFNRDFTLLPLYVVWRMGWSFNKVVINPRGELNPGALKLKRAKKAAFLSVFKTLNLRNEIRWNATNAEERLIISKKLNVKRPIVVMSNIPKPVPPASNKSLSHQNKFIFLSRIDKMKNLDFAIDIFVNIKEDVQFHVYGPIANKAYWAYCQSLAQRLPSNVDFQYMGFVNPSQVSVVLKEYDFFVLPTRGENFGHAIMDALSAGLPLLISDRTPWSQHNLDKIGFDLPLGKSEIWTNSLRALIALSADEYMNRSNEAHLLAQQIASDPTYIHKVKKLFPLRTAQ